MCSIGDVRPALRELERLTRERRLHAIGWVSMVDMMRNDLGRIAEIGTLVVPRLFQPERHPTLWPMTKTTYRIAYDQARVVHLEQLRRAAFGW